MKSRAVLIATISVLLVTGSFAQRRGNPGMQGGGQGRGAQSSAGIRTRDQQRLRIHATDQQRQQLRTCTQSADRIRKQARDMDRVSGSGPISREQAQQFRERLRNEMQTMNQNHERLMAGWSDEQKNAVRQTVEEMEQSRTQLRRSSDQLDASLNAPELNRDRIRLQAQETERAAKQLRKCQTDLSAQLNKTE